MKNTNYVNGRKFAQNIKYLFVGIGAGVINGLFGAGAGLVIVPAIALISKNESRVIHATTVCIVLLMSMVSAAVYLIKKQVSFELIFPCSIGGLIGGIVGTFLLKKLKNEVIDFIFSIIVIFAGIMMIVL